MNDLQSKTKAEKEVEEFLKKYFKCMYEQPIYVIDLDNRPRIWCPDFYLPQLGIHIEVCGAERDYEYRKKVCDKNNISIIFIEYWKYNKKQWQTYIIKCILNRQKSRQELILKLSKLKE